MAMLALRQGNPERPVEVLRVRSLLVDPLREANGTTHRLLFARPLGKWSFSAGLLSLLSSLLGRDDYLHAILLHFDVDVLLPDPRHVGSDDVLFRHLSHVHWNRGLVWWSSER